MPEKTYTTAEAAEILKVDPWTVRQYIKRGILKAHKPGGKWLITENTMNVFLAGNNSLAGWEQTILHLMQASRQLESVRTISMASSIPEHSVRKILATMEKKGLATVSRKRHNLFTYSLTKLGKTGKTKKTGKTGART